MATRHRLNATRGSTNGEFPNNIQELSSTVREAESTKAPQENVFLFVPNLIGYARIVLAIASLYYMPFHPRTCCFLYSTSCLLDALDGAAARKLEQSTQFGTVLDMVTDRCTTSCLLVFLATAYPKCSIIFQGLISLDFASHFIHMYATLVMGSNSQSHKKVAEDRPWVMKIYYSNTNVLFAICLLNEMFFISLYLLSFSSPDLVLAPMGNSGRMSSMQSSLPLSTKSTWTAPWGAGSMDAAKANGLIIPWFTLWGSCLFMLVKQVINVIQLIEASKWLVEGDIKRRTGKKGI